MWPLGRMRFGRGKPRVSDLMRQLREQHDMMARLRKERDINRLNAWHLEKRNCELEAELRGEREIIKMFLESTPLWGAFRHFLGMQKDG